MYGTTDIIKELRLERDHYREALEDIARGCRFAPRTNGILGVSRFSCKGIARDALDWNIQ